MSRDTVEGTITSESRSVPRQKTTTLSSVQPATYLVPRLVVWFVCQFHHHWKRHTTTTLLQTPVAKSIDDVDNTDATVKYHWSRDRTENIGSILDPPLVPSPPPTDRDDMEELSSGGQQRFFPVPAADNAVTEDPKQDPTQQAMWNLTQDLLSNETGETWSSDGGHNGSDDVKDATHEGTITVAMEYSNNEGIVIEDYTQNDAALTTFEDDFPFLRTTDERTKHAETVTSTEEYKRDLVKSREENSGLVAEIDDLSFEDDLASVVVQSDGSNIENITIQSYPESMMSDGDMDNLKHRSAEIAHSFYAKRFQPAWFATNPHLQTIVAVKARQESMYFPTTGNLVLSMFEWDKRQRVETPDDDFFHVDWKFAPASSTLSDGPLRATTEGDDSPILSSTTTPVVLICHGLQSNTDSPLIKDMAIAFNFVGMDVAAINFRGCSGEPNRTPMGYHLSFTDDLELTVKQISTQQPGRPIFLSGFSLGANVVTNLLANLGRRAAKEYNIWGAAVNAVPFDLTKTQAVNEPGLSGALYGNLLLKSLQNRILRSMETIDYNFTKEELEKCTNCKEFDDLVVCSVYKQFENADDYHRKSSTHNRLHEIMVPHFILQAMDDPFFVGNTNPKNDPTLPCRIEYSKHGGHCGFVFHSEERDKRESSFLPTELARFVEHVYKARTGQKSTTVALRKPTNTMKTDAMTTSESLRRKMAAATSHAFNSTEFVPIEWAKNEHLQTIIGALFRRQTMYINNQTETPKLVSLMEAFSEPYEFHWDERERISTLDGDFFDVDWKYAISSYDESLPSNERPVVLICHGLQSDSSSPLAQDMALAFNNVGMHAACINFRGCSGEINKTPVGYHLGFTEDLKQMIERVHKKNPFRRIYLSGFSLGSAVVTTCLAELGERAYDYNIFGAAVNAVPFDMPKAQLNLNRDGLTKWLYGGRLLASMIDRVEASYDHIEFHFPREEAHKCKSIMDMENLVIAPIFGFEDAYDYYKRTSVLPHVDKVAVPELVIQAKDDPFFAGQSLPVDDPSRPLRVVMTDHGGHCGYVFHSTDGKTCKTSWMPTELARFLAHLEETFVLGNSD